MFSDYIYEWLDNALDYGISEKDFWEMTLAELRRLIESKKRVQKEQAKEKASCDYILADLIGKSVARVFNSANTMPDISEVYPTLFDSKELEEKKQEMRDELSAIRFRQFALSHNQKFRGGANKNE